MCDVIQQEGDSMLSNNGTRGEKASPGFFSRKAPERQRRKRSRGSARVAVVLVPILAFGLVLAVRAAAPAGGTIGPAGPTLTWTGTAVGGSSANEGTCVD